MSFEHGQFEQRGLVGQQGKPFFEGAAEGINYLKQYEEHRIEGKS